VQEWRRAGSPPDATQAIGGWNASLLHKGATAAPPGTRHVMTDNDNRRLPLLTPEAAPSLRGSGDARRAPPGATPAASGAMTDAVPGGAVVGSASLTFPRLLRSIAHVNCGYQVNG
jgi:hypothetical protein